MAKIGHEAPHFDYAAEPESDQLRIDLEPKAESLPKSEVAPEPVKTSSDREIDPQIPPKVRETLRHEFSEADTEFDRRDKNYPRTMAQNRQEIGGVLLTPEDIEKPKRAVSKPSRRPKKDRRHLSHLGKLAADEAPAHERVPTTSGQLTEEEKEIGKAAADAARRALGLDR